MIPLFSTSQIREIDSFAINHLGIPGIVLMENASMEIHRILMDRFSDLGKISCIGIICGKGNNGGDGYAAARHLADSGYKVIVISLGEEDEMSPDCKTNFRILKNLGEQNPRIQLILYRSEKDLRQIEDCDVVVDAMLGSGASGELKQPYNDIAAFINEIKCFKAAIDIPTGLDADKGTAYSELKVDLTITLGEFKKGLFIEDGYANCGEVIKGGIGISSSYYDRYSPYEFLIEPEDAYESLPKKNKNVHKYSAGKVLVVAGSESFPGAAALTSKAALKAGAGSSVLCFPKSVRKLLFKNISEVVVESYDDENNGYLIQKNIDQLVKRFEWADTAAIGPGLGRNERTMDAVISIIKKRKCSRMVIDADALFSLKDYYKNLNLKGYVLTPHHGEFASLIGIDLHDLKKDILRYGKEFSKETKSILVLKGAPTVIFDGETAYINTAGNPGMAKFGTGDVLTGVMAGFISQHGDILDSVISSVYLHSLASDILMQEMSEYGYTALDIMNKFPKSIQFLRKSVA